MAPPVKQRDRLFGYTSGYCSFAECYGLEASAETTAAHGASGAVVVAGRIIG